MNVYMIKYEYYCDGKWIKQIIHCYKNESDANKKANELNKMPKYYSMTSYTVIKMKLE